MCFFYSDSVLQNTVGTVGKSHYCQCPKSVATSPLICDTIVGQCKYVFTTSDRFGVDFLTHVMC
jgi:hypothetical protein